MSSFSTQSTAAAAASPAASREVSTLGHLTAAAVGCVVDNNSCDHHHHLPYPNHSSPGNETVIHPGSIWAVEPAVSAIVVPIIFGIIFVVGLIGNGTLIFTVAVNKVMRNVPNILIVSLSVGDFLLILISVPMTSTIYTFRSWPYGEVMCKFNRCMQTWSLGVTVFTLTLLSYDRYTAIMDPMSKHKGKTMKATVGTCAAIWVVSLLLGAVDAFFTQLLVDLEEGIVFCNWLPKHLDEMAGPEWTVPKTYVLTRFVVFFAAPVVIIAIFYMMMARILIRSGEQMPCEGKSGSVNQQRQIAARKKVARVVLSFVVIFIVCWLPSHVYQFWFYYTLDDFNDFWHIFKIGSFCLSFVNSCINPFALYFLSSQFRKYYNRYLFCCFQRAPYIRMAQEPSSTMHNFNSTVRRASSTQTSIVQSQSMC